MTDRARGRGETDAPLLLLDVDGVLCPFEGGVPSMRRMGHAGFERIELPDDFGEDYVWIARANADRLRRLTGAFEVVWATGWGDHANRVIGPVHDLDRLAVIELSMSDEPTWKLPSVAAYVGERRPCVWIDDDLGEDAERWAESRPGPTMLLRASPEVGLTDDMVERCLRFADGVR